MQRNIVKHLMMIRKLMLFFDDGYHLDQCGQLTKMSNELFEKLNSYNKLKFKIWLAKKEREGEL